MQAAEKVVNEGETFLDDVFVVVSPSCISLVARERCVLFVSLNCCMNGINKAW